MGLVNSFILVRIIPNKRHTQQTEYLIRGIQSKTHYIWVIIREEISVLFKYEELS